MRKDFLTYGEAAVLSQDGLFERLGAKAEGLSNREAERRRERFGPNLVTFSQTTWQCVLFRQLKSSFTYLLLAATAVSLYVGEWIDAILIGTFILINVALGFYQEYRAERAARLLRKFWKNDARVIRGGKTSVVDAETVVPGDIIRLQTGDKIPADVRFLETDALLIDESILTGESGVVEKDGRLMDEEPDALHKAANIGFGGTSVQMGEATAVVFSIGAASSLGAIVRLTGATSTSGVFEREIAAFSRFILKLVAATLGIVFLLNIAAKGVGQIEELFIFVIALTIGVVPEALPVVMTVAHSRAAMRLAKKNVIVKRLTAIDDLGSIDVLATDKTGTITKNEMHVAAVHAADVKACRKYALLASPAGAQRSRSSGAFDTALWRDAGDGQHHEFDGYRRVAELPFDPIRRLNSVLLEGDEGRIIVTKGAPEEVIARCRAIADPLGTGKLIEREGHSGRRVLAVAVKRNVTVDKVMPDDEHGLEFMGLISFEDPLKPSSAGAVSKAGKMGVRVIMLTGDTPEVAFSVAQRLNMVRTPDEVMTGAEFDALGTEAQLDAVERVGAFARVSPEQKFAILGLLKEKGLSVGFIGEGFNDAPGLKLADVAIAVENASDIAKDASDIILGSKSLSAIVDGIEIGRRNFANIIKYLRITLASNFGNFYSVAIASLLVPFLPMLPVQILLLNLITDAPMIAIAADEVALEDLKKPSKYSAKSIILSATTLGAVSSSFDFLTFALFRGLGEGTLQTLWFMESAITEIVLIFSIRTSKPFYRGPRLTTGMRRMTIAVISAVLLLPFLPFGHSIFRFVTPTGFQLFAVVSVIAAYFITTETVKLRLLRNGHEKGRGQ